MKIIVALLFTSIMFMSCGSSYNRCTGEDNCDVCTDCSRCNYCSDGEGTCGVCE